MLPINPKQATIKRSKKSEKKISRKTSRKTSRKASRKTSKKTSKKTSIKTSKSQNSIKTVSLNSFKNKECSFDKDNKCQTKFSGGHQGTIFSVKNKYCAKLVGNKDDVSGSLEFIFLSDPINQNLFKGFIPEYLGFCNKNKKNYIVIENLKYGCKMPITLDIKIGFDTANKEILKKINHNFIRGKILKHKIIDYKSQSAKHGFRAEGVDSQTKISKSSLKNKPAPKFLIEFLHKDPSRIALKGILRKLKKYYKVISSSKFDNHVMVGSSLLLVYDGQKPSKNRVSIIDFANSAIFNNISNYNKKFVQQYRNGISNLINEMEVFLEKNL